MDIIFINELKVKTLIGIKAKERKQKQIIIIDLEIATDIRQAATSDNIASTFNYETITTHIKQFAKNSKYNLIESFAEVLAKLLMDEFSIMGLRLRVSKINAVPNTKTTGIMIERGKF